jgi:hypothetical protein
MRVCVIGDSHLAAIKVGRDKVEQNGGDSLLPSFFGARSQLMRDLKAEGTALVPASAQLHDDMKLLSAGKASIEVADYDAFVIVALGFNIRRIIPWLLGRFVTVEYRSHSSNVSLVSDDCLLAAAKGILSDTIAVRTMDMILGIARKPVVLVPQPLPAERLLQVPAQRNIFPDMIARGNAEFGYRLFRDAAAEIMRERGIEIEQPGETRTQHILTKNEFSVGSVRLTGTLESQHAENDFGHMNAEFGVHVWRKLAPALQGLAGRTI